MAVVSEDEELCAVEETSHMTDDDDDDDDESHQRLYGRQQISFTVCSHVALIAAGIGARDSTGYR